MIEASKSAAGKLAYTLNVAGHSITSDVSVALGGDDLGPDPHDLLDAALTACTALTVTMVARRKAIPLTDVQVRITHVEADGLYSFNRQIKLLGALSGEQRDYLLGIANKCPIHRALLGRFEVLTVLAE